MDVLAYETSETTHQNNEVARLLAITSRSTGLADKRKGPIHHFGVKVW